MRDWGSVEVGTIATISTGHIPQEKINELERLLVQNEENNNPYDHWSRRINIANWNYGYLVNGGDLKRYSQTDKVLPKFLKELAELVADLNLQWICYDRDGDIVEGMTYYEGD